MSEESENTSGKATAFIAGMAVGAGLAIVYPPKVLREIVTRLFVTKVVMGKVKSYAEGVQDRVFGTVEEGIGILFKRRSSLTGAFRAARDAMHREKLRISARKKV